jgi:hypothetical protein
MTLEFLDARRPGPNDGSVPLKMTPCNYAGILPMVTLKIPGFLTSQKTFLIFLGRHRKTRGCGQRLCGIHLAPFDPSGWPAFRFFCRPFALNLEPAMVTAA